MTQTGGMKTVAELMAVAAITAPKTRGENFVQVMILEGDKVQELGRAMTTYGAMFHKKNFDRDGLNVEASEIVILIGLKDATVSSLDCGACGFGSCAELEGEPPVDAEFRGPTCALRLLDMGIALGSAVKMASLLNVDNRVMYRIGAVARHLRWVDWDFVMGIPLSVTGKSPYFDRK
jgi:uncharacterized ferredoxin-like protein